MLISCWSAKGGSGTTVVATALALLLSRRSPGGAVIADLAGDVPTVLGLPDPSGPGLREWLEAGPDVPDDALRRIEIDARPGLGLLAWSSGRPVIGAAPDPFSGADGERLAATLAASTDRPVVVDCGSTPGPAAVAVAASAAISLLVLRPCYLGLRRALQLPTRPSGVILLTEPGRSLSGADVEDVLGVPVRAEIPWDPSVARAVDAGLLAARVPRGLERALRRAA